MTPASPFHEGEQRVQARLGVREEIEPWARRVIRPFLPDPHREFYARLPFLVVAARDATGRPWATLLVGEPGFVSSPDARILRVASLPSPGDALATALRGGDDVGIGHREAGRESAAFGMDASHRGGAPGFVRVRDERRLVFPDYAGNNHFNTIGNLLLDPRVGLLFVDFERGDLLQLTGRARIDWDSPEVGRFPGAHRLVHVEVEEVVALRGALPLRWNVAGEAVRELRVGGKERESEDVTSFLLEACDGERLPDFVAGQYLPVELEIPGQPAPVVRTYSLSDAPGDRRYRISVKRHPRGLASRHLHDRVEVGDVLRAGTPRGEFVLDAPSARPVALVSAGVGLTPLVAMLRALASDAERRVWFIHGARDGDHHPLRREVQTLVEAMPNLRLHVAYSRPRPQDVAGRDYQSEGRVDGALLEKLVPALEADFYLCGPSGFMAAIQADLETRGVPSQHIHTESFGPAVSSREGRTS